MALAFRLRLATPSDAQALAAIELESFPDPSWNAQDFLRYDCMVAETEIADLRTVISGFLVSRETFRGTTETSPEREILNLAISKPFRRSGVASALLAHELTRAANVFLEVRESNLAAIQLYKNAGFIEISRRPAYYDNPAESAIVMRTK